MAMCGRGDPIVMDSWASACEERRLSSALVAEQCNTVAQQSHMHQCPISLRPDAQVPVRRKLFAATPPFREVLAVEGAACQLPLDEMPSGLQGPPSSCPGHKPAVISTAAPRQVTLGTGEVKAAWVAAGSEHSVAGLRDGSVFTWGWGEHGQLGRGSTTNCWHPQTGAGLRCNPWCSVGIMWCGFHHRCWYSVT